MRVALFIPCYVDQLRPEVGLATLALLRSVEIEPAFPLDQTCCGQPFLTAGETRQARRLMRRASEVFRDFDHVVAPSGSCVATLRRHAARLVGDDAARALGERTSELCEFLIDQSLDPPFESAFPHRVGLHASCHALRELRLGTPSETREPVRPDPAATLLSRLPGITFADLARRDECCGFGGLFSVVEADVSTRMGLDRLEDHRRGRAEVICSTDVSCLLHLEGLDAHERHPLRAMHVAEILAACLPEVTRRGGQPLGSR